MKEVPSVASPVKEKLGRKKWKRKRYHEPGDQNENMTNVSYESVNKKKVKKIKIRLADPNIPDSYICEVFDSSLEREEAEERHREEEEENKIRGKDKLKQRNFFDVLMSRDSRRNFLVNSAVENEEIPEVTKLLREVEGDDVIQKRKSTKAKNKGKLMELVNRKKKKKKKKMNGYSRNSSDDESIFEVQSTLKFFANDSKEVNTPKSSDEAKNKENAAFVCDDDDDDSSKSDGHTFPPSKRKNSNILSYFSVTDARTRVKPRKENNRLKPRKLTEINMFENARKGHSPERGGNDNVNVKKKENIKLAPLFQKKVKAIVDPKVQKARMDFLQNGLPTNMRKINDNRKDVEEKYQGANFPDVSHVQQKDDDPLWCSENVFIPLLKANESSCYNCKEKTFRFEIMDEGVSPNGGELANQSSLHSLRLRYKDLNVETIFNGFEVKKRTYMRKIEECGKDCDSDNSIEVVTDCGIGDGCYSLWTEVYRPKSDEIMGNKQTVTRLSGWLKSWKEYNNEIKKSNERVKIKTLASSDDSDDAFVASDDENCALRSPVNICLLSGPIASGKTALVYALAAEFDYNVLEVNSSSRRTGRKLLLDLQEATKSHQVRSGFNVMPVDDRGKQQKTKKKKKKKKRKVELNGNEQGSSKISLILIEDADIFFEEHDEGFVSAISTLVQSSKRPFIFLSNDPNYGYLERLKQQPMLQLEMRRPNFQNASAVLDVIAAVEGVSLDREMLDNLIQGNNYDLRKSILELQFWVQSGKKLIRKVGNESDLGKLWWGFNKFLYKEENAHNVKLDYRKRKRSRELYDSSEEEMEEAQKKAKLNEGVAKAFKAQERTSDSAIHVYRRILDSVSVSDLFKFSTDVEPIPWNECRPKDGLSLSECMESVDWRARDLSALIIKELVGVSARVFADCAGRDAKCVLSNPSWSEIRWRSLQHDAKQDLMSLLPSSLGNSRRSIHLDYLPVIRNICRAEKNRYMGNTKRKNRFNHYFRTLGCDPRDETLEISCDIFDS